MVKKEETKKKAPVKKTAAKKDTKVTTKTTSKTAKKPVKEVVEVKVEKETKKEVKKENKFVKTIKSIGSKIGAFLNDPRPIIIFLCVLVFIFIISFANFKSKYKILVGSVQSENIAIRLVQIDMNPKVNTALGTQATYIPDDKEVYAYIVGYYYEVAGELKPFSVSMDESDKPMSLKEMVSATSNVSIIEFAKNESSFTKEAKNNINKLHFVVRARTSKETDAAFDINIDEPIKFTNLSE